MAGSSSTTSSEAMGNWVIAPAVTPEPKPTSATRGGGWRAVGVEQQRQQPHLICVGMSASLEASTLPLFLSEYVLPQRSTETVVATPSS